MAQIECGRGHLYDPEKYSTCPYCGGGQKITVASAGRTAPLGSRPVTAVQRTAPVSVTAPQKTAPLSGISVTAPQKTMPPRGYTPVGVPEETALSRGVSISATAANKTVGMMQSQMGFDPVVGWLACVAGPSRGKSYTVRGGVNSIGRSERMDIVITGDGRNIVYLNDEEVYTPMLLNAYDVIDFGETKLLFVPLCGQRFTWKTEEKDGAV